jgi:hypothetical protein
MHERRDAKYSHRTTLFGDMIVMVAWAVFGTDGNPCRAQEQEVITQGQVYYQQYCTSCHSLSVKSDGP